MKRRGRAIAVLTGYAAAFVIALAAVFARSLLLPNAGGMQAFGDLLFFAGAFALLALAPTALALYFLRSSQLFWKVLSALSLVFACTGLIAGLHLHLHRHQLDESISGLLALLRVIGAPVLCVGFVVGAVIAPAPRARLFMFFAAFAEAVVSAYLVLSLSMNQHWL